MPIPDYESLMLPLLRVAGDKREHRPREMTDCLADQFKLSPEERAAQLPSGVKDVMYSRVHWAKTYLLEAGLLESVARGRYRITQRGLDVLASNPSRIDNKYLEQYKEFLDFRRRRRPTSPGDDNGAVEAHTPEELLESSYQELRDALAQELLARIKSAPAEFFEQLVVDLLVGMGYGGSRKDAGKAVGRSGDGGIDGIIKEDKLGLDVVYIQAKRWDSTVGRPTVQTFVGSLVGRRATKGVLITTSDFAAPARQYVREIDKNIVLIDGEELAQLMIDHDIGVTEVAAYKVKKVDLDYFGEE
jgi:restriction system protein